MWSFGVAGVFWRGVVGGITSAVSVELSDWLVGFLLIAFWWRAAGKCWWRVHLVFLWNVQIPHDVSESLLHVSAAAYHLTFVHLQGFYSCIKLGDRVLLVCYLLLCSD